MRRDGRSQSVPLRWLRACVRASVLAFFLPFWNRKEEERATFSLLPHTLALSLSISTSFLLYGGLYCSIILEEKERDLLTSLLLLRREFRVEEEEGEEEEECGERDRWFSLLAHSLARCLVSLNGTLLKKKRREKGSLGGEEETLVRPSFRPSVRRSVPSLSLSLFLPPCFYSPSPSPSKLTSLLCGKRGRPRFHSSSHVVESSWSSRS